MLTEDQVVDAVCRELDERGYLIVERAAITQHGHDIVATKASMSVIIEAKGAGSSKPGTARFGNEFNSNQVNSHVARAVLKAMRVVSAGEARAGIALPDNQNHRQEVDQISAAPGAAGIAVFWVREPAEVKIDSPWQV
jgi:hypothetical protein